MTNKTKMDERPDGLIWYAHFHCSILGQPVKYSFTGFDYGF